MGSQNEANNSDANGLFQLRHQMISLIHHLNLSDNIVRKVMKLVGAAANEKRRADAMGYLVKISNNLHMFARHVCTKSPNPKITKSKNPKIQNTKSKNPKIQKSKIQKS